MAVNNQNNTNFVAHVRLTDNNHDSFRNASKLEHMGMTAWMRRTCAIEAERVLNAQKTK